MRSLPNTLAADRIADNIQQLRASVNNSTILPPKKGKKAGPTEFEWIPDPYELADEHNKSLERQSKAKNVTDAPFVSMVNMKREKYTNMLGQPDSCVKYGDDPYDAMKEKSLREAWLERLKILYGDFKPCLEDRNLEKVGRSQLPDIVIQLRKCIAQDWPDAHFLVGCITF